MAKFIVGGGIVGVFVGVIAVLMFPDLMLLEVILNNSSKSTDPFTTIGIPIPLLFGVLGGILGFIYYKTKFKE